MVEEMPEQFSPLCRAMQRESRRGAALKAEIVALVLNSVAREPEGLSIASIKQMLCQAGEELASLPVKFIGYVDEADQPLT